MTSRDQMLTRVRGALGRSPGDPAPAPPPVRLILPETQIADRVGRFSSALTALAGKVSIVQNLAHAKTALESILEGRTVVVSPASSAFAEGRASRILTACGMTGAALSRGAFSREACATAEIGVSSADFALADTGSLVFLSESRESRLISLLPPIHIAVIARESILSGLDELLTVVPQPAAQSSAMVLITGPSRTADIEMRLVRGVHGPGEIHVMIVEDVTASQSNASEGL